MPDRPESTTPEPSVAVQLVRIVRETLDAQSPADSLPTVLAALTKRLSCRVGVVAELQDADLIPVAAFGVQSKSLPVGARIPIAVGISGAVARLGQPQVHTRSDRHTAWMDVSDGVTTAGVAVPMRLPSRLWGVLLVEAEDSAQIGPELAADLEPVADLLAWVLQEGELRRTADRLEDTQLRLRHAIETSSAVVGAGLQETTVVAALERMLGELRLRMPYESAEVLLADGDLLVSQAAYGFLAESGQSTFKRSRGVLGHVATTGEPHLAADVRNDPYYLELSPATRSELCVPLRVSGVMRGVLNVESSTADAFDDVDLQMVGRIADQMSLVVHNLELMEGQRDQVVQLHELDRLKSRLLTLASHELRTPLTVVMGFSEILMEHMGSLDADQAVAHATAIHRHTAGLTALVDQMLLMSQLEQGNVSVRCVPVSLLETIESVVARHVGNIQVLSGVQGTRVKADADRLEQVLGILVDNAVKYAADGVIQINAKVTGDEVAILLRDEGPGISGTEHAMVFEPFHQIGEHGIAGRRGVGLGLSLARDLVRLMGGQLKLVSAEGYGATFLLNLPRA